jgi:hypothetical protein
VRLSGRRVVKDGDRGNCRTGFPRCGRREITRAAILRDFHVVKAETSRGQGQEVLYIVLDGNATFQIDGDTVDAPAGAYATSTDVKNYANVLNGTGYDLTPHVVQATAEGGSINLAVTQAMSGSE